MNASRLGLVKESDVDTALGRVLYSRIKLGFLDADQVRYEHEHETLTSAAVHFHVSRPQRSSH